MRARVAIASTSWLDTNTRKPSPPNVQSSPARTGDAKSIALAISSAPVRVRCSSELGGGYGSRVQVSPDLIRAMRPGYSAG